MAKDSRKLSSDETVRADDATTLETLIRRRARGLIDAIVEEELDGRWERRNRRAWDRCVRATGMGRASGR